MGWLAFGVGYSILYAVIGAYLRPHPNVLPWFRIAALLVPPMVGAAVIVARRLAWAGCQWLFWATLALGLVMSAISVVGWSVDEMMLGISTSWLGWHAVFALFGGVAPLLALLAQPHRGAREKVTATTAVDIAGIAVLTGFLYSHFVVASDVAASQGASQSLLLLSELQQVLVCVGMFIATFRAQDPEWKATYRRLTIGLAISFITLSLSNAEIWQGFYQTASLGDVMWILPFSFYPWAASKAPASKHASPLDADAADETPSRPWVIFAGLALLPLIDFGLRQTTPTGPFDSFQDLSTAVAIVSVLPLLMARLAVERAELRQADVKLRLMGSAVEEAHELILIMSSDGAVRHANRAFCASVGYELEELLDRPPAFVLADDSKSRLDEIRKMAKGDSWTGVLNHQRRDGSMFQAACAVVPLCIDNQEVTNFVFVERDITEELRLRGQLIHSERLSAVGQLVSGVAHELNNPLQSILGFTELLIDADSRQEMRRDLEQVRSEAVRAGKIVRNLLAFVRRSSSERSVANVNDIVRTTISLRSYEFVGANVRLIESYAEGLPHVVVSPEEIQQVILNLILNAEQAMRTANHGGILTVATNFADGMITVDIRDDGPGVPPALAGKIFEPFFSTKEVGEGTGLGLSIGLGIAEAHGGSLTLLPSDKGAWFRLSIPAASTDETAAVPSLVTASRR